MSTIDKLKEDFKNKLSGKAKSYKHEATGITIYWKPENMAQRSQYYGGLIKNDIAAFVDLLVARALNEHGTKMFKPADKEVLLKQTDPKVIMDLANAILNDGAGDDYEEATKN